MKTKRPIITIMKPRFMIHYGTLTIAAGLTVLSADLHAQTTPAPQPNICSRSCWGARAGSCSTSLGSLNRAIIHHTANQNDFGTTSLEASKAKMRAHQNDHMDNRGFCDIGYHFMVDKLGNIFEARAGSMGTSSQWKRGSHAGCGNNNTMGFTLMGYFHTPYNQTPTTAQLNSIYDVVAWRMPSGWTPYGGRTSYPGSLNGTAAPLDTHAWVGASSSSGCSGTACPGSIVINNYVTSNFNGGPMRTGIANRRTTAVNNAAVVSMNYPSTVSPGQTFSATVTMNNNGGTHWVDSNNYRLGSQNPQDNTRWGLSRVGFSGTISPGQSHAFTFNCTAPTTAGSYAFDWKMLQESVQWFGATATGGISVASASVIVDNQQATYVGTWATGSSSTDKYGADYRYHSTAAVSEPATFTGNITSGSKNVYAWWPQGANRSTTAPYIVDHSAGTTTVNKNQQINGGSWQLLGTWSFNAGNNTVKLSCWTSTGYIVVADAVKWE